MFLPVPNAEALREQQGTRDTTPVLCRGHPLAAAARGIGTDGTCCCKSIHRVEPVPRALGAPAGALADMDRRERAQADRIARSAVWTRGEPVTWGRHLRQPEVSTGALGQFARRHYWLAPRSDDAVGAGFGLEQGAAGLQQLDFGCRRFGPAGRIGGAVGPRDRQ